MALPRRAQARLRLETSEASSSASIVSSRETGDADYPGSLGTVACRGSARNEEEGKADREGEAPAP